MGDGRYDGSMQQMPLGLQDARCVSHTRFQFCIHTSASASSLDCRKLASLRDNTSSSSAHASRPRPSFYIHRQAGPVSR